MNIAQKTSISTLMPQIVTDDLTILVDHALLSGFEDARSLERLLKNLRIPHFKELVSQCPRPTFYPHALTALSSSFDLAFAMTQSTQQLDGLTAQAHLAFRSMLNKTDIESNRADSGAEGKEGTEETGYAFVHLCHWRVGGGRVLMSSAQALNAQTQEQLRQKLEPLFASEGIELFAFRDDTWIARSKHFLNLPSANPHQVMNDDVLPWLIGSPQRDEHNTNTALEPSVRTLRRLQSEIQMVLYDQHTHTPSPQSVNSVWFSGTGTLPKAWHDLRYLTPMDQSDVELIAGLNSQILCLHTLTPPMQNHDFNAWCDGFEQLDQTVFKSLQSSKRLRLVLCGRLGYKVWRIQPISRTRGALQWMKHQFFAPPDHLQLLS